MICDDPGTNIQDFRRILQSKSKNFEKLARSPAPLIWRNKKQRIKTKFKSQEAINETNQEFRLNRQWGIKGYPSILIKKEDQLYLIANGYAQFPELKERLDDLAQKK